MSESEQEARIDDRVDHNVDHSVDDDGELERALDELTAASRARAAELRAIVTALPEVTSRRTQLRSIVLSVTGAPDMPLRSRQFVLRVISDQTSRIRRAVRGLFSRDVG